MRNLKGAIKAARINRRAETKLAAGPGLEKAPEAKAAKKKAAKNLFEEHETKPMKEPAFMTCSFCGEEFSGRGIGRHIKAIHLDQGLPLEDLDRVNQGKITLPDLLDEKGITTIYGLSSEIEKKYFSNWKDTEEAEDPEGNKDPEKEDLEEAQEEEEKNPDNPNEERRRFNLMPPFSLFDRRCR